jgi:enoyl-CoA hydratase
MTTTPDTLVSYVVDGPVARITVDSPHNRNATSARLVDQLHEGLRTAAADTAIRAVVLGHTGGTFCAGADLSEASSGDHFEAAMARSREMTSLLRTILECPSPVIAAINGHVRAGGKGLIGASDMVVAGHRRRCRLRRRLHHRRSGKGFAARSRRVQGPHDRRGAGRIRPRCRALG